MMLLLLMSLSYMFLAPAGASEVRVVDHWIRVSVDMELENPVQGGWQIQLELDTPATDIRVWMAEVVRAESDSQHWLLTNAPYNKDLKKGKHSFKLELKFSGLESPGCLRAWLVGVEKANPCSLEPTGDQQMDSTTSTIRGRPSTLTPGIDGNQGRWMTKGLTPPELGTTARAYTTRMKPMTPTTSMQSPSVATTSPAQDQSRSLPVRVRFRRPSMFSGELRTVMTTSMDGWALKLVFSSPVQRLMSLRTDVVSVSADKKVYILRNKSFNKQMAAGDVMRLLFTCYSGPYATPEHIYAFLATDVDQLPRPTTFTDVTSTQTPAPTLMPIPTSKPKATAKVTQKPTSTTASISEETRPAIYPSTSTKEGKYDYGDVLHKSISFYEAHRSGKLPLEGSASQGGDIKPTEFDQHELMKRVAVSTTTLLWGMLEYREVYEAAGELHTALNSVHWLLDYLIQSYTTHSSLHTKTIKRNEEERDGSGEIPPRAGSARVPPVTSHVRSDVTADIAAAMTAGAMIFSNNNHTYSRALLTHARFLYNLAFNTRHLDQKSRMETSPHEDQDKVQTDELGWAAIWLYLQTREERYLRHANQFIPKHLPKEYSADDQSPGYMLLLYRLTKNPAARQKLEDFLDYWINEVDRTPHGLAWYKQPGANSYAANAAFIALSASKLGIRVSEGRQFARQQIDYMLGDAGHSYVVGFGRKPPQHPTYQPASCSDSRRKCSMKGDKLLDTHLLTGALVSGPDRSGRWRDVRRKPEWNAVRFDYNAGFQSAVAGLRALELE